MNRFPLLSKSLMAALMALLLLIPLGMIESKISERQHLHQSVQNEIARSSSGPQTLNGPYLVVKYRLREHKTYKDLEGNVKNVTSETETREKLIPARNLRLNGSAAVETRKRGIYIAQLFDMQSTVEGDFSVPARFGINKPADDIILEALYFTLGVSDARGILNVPVLTLNGQQLDFEPGAIAPLGGNGIHARLAMPEKDKAQLYAFSFPLNLQGMNSLSVVPAADSTEVKLQSSWPHPSFGGNFLPRSRSVDDSGFKAQWNITNLGRNTVSSDSAGQPGAFSPGNAESFSVSFIDPVNIYLLSERAVKYGVLFVVLVFTAFFMFEMMRNLRIHPLQYLLVGLAMAMFFLLIISLSEHLPFLAAYSISGAACVVLLGAYLTGVMKSPRRGAGFAGGIALLYAVLYGVLQSEDNALLMGTAILFSALAAVMLLTRNMDWYQLRPSTAQAAIEK